MPGTPTNARWKLAALALGAGVAMAACAPANQPPSVPVRVQSSLVTQVVDSPNDAGRGVSVALDENGKPVLSYVLGKAVLKKGDLPVPILAAQPQPPAVLLATQTGVAWNRLSVTKQNTAPAKGEAPGAADSEGHAVPEVVTSLALDGDGKRHVAWSTGAGLFYAGEDAFGDPVKVTPAPTSGASIAVASSGTPWISFYEGGDVKAATESGGTWTIETIAAHAEAVSGSTARTAIRTAADGTPVVAFGASGTTAVATREGGAWTVRVVPGSGGLGVSLALDKSGNPHVAYYDARGTVRHAHSIAGADWEVTDIAAPTAGAPDPAWSTGIALDEQGTHFITWADTAAGDIKVASNSGGAFQPSDVPDSAGGATPAIAVSGDGKDLAVAWYDQTNANLDVATSVGGQVILAFSPQPVPSSGTSGPPPAECSGTSTSLKVVAKGFAFDPECLAAPAGKALTLEFDNQDAGVPHNVDIYTDSSASDHLGGAASASDTITGAGQTTYDIDPLEAGTYFFRCDVHPTMNGPFVVGSGAGPAAGPSSSPSPTTAPSTVPSATPTS